MKILKKIISLEFGMLLTLMPLVISAMFVLIFGLIAGMHLETIGIYIAYIASISFVGIFIIFIFLAKEIFKEK